MRSTLLLSLQLDDVKGELLERLKHLPVVSSRVSELENASDELREKNRQMEQKLATMQVGGGAHTWRSCTRAGPLACECGRHAFVGGLFGFSCFCGGFAGTTEAKLLHCSS